MMNATKTLTLHLTTAELSALHIACEEWVYTCEEEVKDGRSKEPLRIAKSLFEKVNG